MSRILFLNGPNLNMLGIREPELYGVQTLADIESFCRKKAKELGHDIDFRQSNHEGELVTWIQETRGKVDGIVINAGAYTHTSIALLDALKIANVPVIEVHLTDPKKREPFRHISYIELVATKTIAGKGGDGYMLALEELSCILENKTA